MQSERVAFHFVLSLESQKLTQSKSGEAQRTQRIFYSLRALRLKKTFETASFSFHQDPIKLFPDYPRPNSYPFSCKMQLVFPEELISGKPFSPRNALWVSMK